jgi:CelD/BcsL family acetyltransferase involved in cellulose biosynthesis
VGKLQIQRLDSIDAIRCRAAAWDRLWQRSEVSLPTARAELTAQWLEHFARKASFCVLAVEEDGDLVGLLPLAGRKVRRLLPVADLTGNYWSFNGELLLDPQADRAAICDRFAEAVASLPWPLLWVETIPVERAYWQEMRAALLRRKLDVDVHARYRIGQVDLRGSFAEYEGKLSKNHRRSLRKDLHRLEGEGPSQFCLKSEFTAEEVPAALAAVFQVEAGSWKAAADGCVLSVAGLQDFYVRQCRQLAQWGCLRLASLEHGSRPIAFELGWTAKRIFHSIRVGYDQAYRTYGPGHLLRRWLIERLFQEGEVEAIDFQGPMTDALAQWSTSSYQVGRLVAVPSRLSSRALWLACRALTPALRWLRKGEST